MNSPIKIPYIEPQQFLDDIILILQKKELYQEGLLFRSFAAKHLKALKKTGNDRNSSYSQSDIKYGKRKYQAFKDEKISMPDNIDLETFEIMDQFNLKLEDFTFASPERLLRTEIKYPGTVDTPFMRIAKNPEPQLISVYQADKLRNLHTHHAYEFKDKEHKLYALVALFQIIESKEKPKKTDAAYKQMIANAKARYGIN